jgi:hypothetical protein
MSPAEDWSLMLTTPLRRIMDTAPVRVRWGG